MTGNAHHFYGRRERARLRPFLETMTMLRFGVAVLCVVASSSAATAGESPLVCFSNEPSWSIELTAPGIARVTIPGEEPMTFRGVATRNEVLREGLWRGSPAAGRDLVVFLRDAACSDGMSDAKHPVTARVSLPDLRFLAGCCRVPVPAGSATNARRVEGVSWRLTSLSGKDPKVLAALSRPATARFEAGRVSGFSGCNNFMGSYTIDADRVTLGQLAGTMMACPEPAPRLEGVTWDVTGFNNNRHAVVSLLAGTRITFSFADGTASDNAGCNTFRAPFSTQGNGLKVGPAITTRMSCAEELMVQEREFLAALESAVTWSVEGGVLDMHRADEERAIFANVKK